MAKFTFFEADDWCSLFANDVCVHQGHDISVCDLLTILNDNGHNVDFSTHWVDTITFRKIAENNRFSKDLDKIKKQLI